MDSSNNLFSALFDGGNYSELGSGVNASSSVTAFGCVNGINTYAFCQNNGAFTVSQCKKIINLYELATKTGSPIIGFYSSDGVAFNEGFEVLSKYSELLNKAFSVSGVVPQISVVYGACLGVSAIMANTADVVIGVKGFDFYAASDSSNTTDDSFTGGVIDILSDDVNDAIERAKSVLSLLPQNNLSQTAEFEYNEPTTYDDIVSLLADEGSSIRLKNDYADGVDTALATLGGKPVGIVAFKGKELCPACCYKAESLIKLCDAFNLPVITVADSEGFADASNSQLITALTKLASAYSNATCVKISLISKASVGGSYILLAGKGANADLTFSIDSAIATPLPVSSAVAFLFGERLANGESREELEKEYTRDYASVLNAAKAGAVDDVFQISEVRNKLISALNMLSSKRETTIPRKHTVK